MKRLASATGAILVAGLALAAWLSTATASSNAVRVCHKTSSKAKPYVLLSVSSAQAKVHGKHPADIIPAPKGGCPKSVMTATTGGTAFSVAMVGEVEQPAGDPVATGTATVRLRAGQGQVCYQIAADHLPAAVAAHIHKGAAGVAGPVVIPLQTPNAQGKTSGCAAVARTLVAQVLKAPASYYVNVHTQENPAGAIRGQLTGTSQSAFGWIVAKDLQGTSEPNAKGTAVVRIPPNATNVCYRLHAESITLPAVAAHIHRGAAGVNGPVVVPLTAPAADGNSSGCATADSTLINDITTNPANFYVNVHTKEHPAGAMRTQLG